MAKENLQFPKTKSHFHLGGEVVGLKNPRKNQGYIKGKTKDGREYHRISFAVKTSPDNIVNVEVFGTIPDKVYAYNQKLKESKALSWAKRDVNLADGWRRIYSSYEVVQQLKDELSDGDMVKIHGELEYSSFTTNDGKVIPRCVSKINSFEFYDDDKEPDFNSEDFKEYNYFTQELIVDNVFSVDEKTYLLAYIVKYGEILFPVQFELDQAIIKNMKRLPFGTFLKAEGIQNNRVVLEEVTDDDGWGVRKENIIKDRKFSLVLYAVDPNTIEEKRYSKKEIDVQLEKQIARTTEQDKNFNPEKKQSKPQGAQKPQTHFDEDDDDIFSNSDSDDDYEDDIFA